MIEKIGKEYIFINMNDAVQYLNKVENNQNFDREKYALQSNVN